MLIPLNLGQISSFERLVILNEGLIGTRNINLYVHKKRKHIGDYIKRKHFEIMDRSTMHPQTLKQFLFKIKCFHLF